MKIALGNVCHTYGAFGANHFYTFKLPIKMKDLVDGEILESAIRKTEKRYPYFCLRMRKNDSEYFYEKNSAPVVLLNTNEKIILNSAQTNYHVWAVCYKDEWIFIDCYHGIADGGGSMPLVATLLYYYCNEKYGLNDKTGIRTLEDEIFPDETSDPFESLPRINIDEMPPIKSTGAFSLIDDGGERGNSSVHYNIILPESAFMKFTSANDSSPGTMISLLMARAIDANYPNRKKPVTSTYVINCRPMLNSLNSFPNCLDSAIFVYDDRMKKIPFDKQTTIYRGKTFLASDEDRIKNNLTVLKSLTENILEKNSTLEEKKSAFAKLFNRDFENTFMVSYVGKWRFPAIGKYIDCSFVHIAPRTLAVEVTAFNGKIGISIFQNFEGDGLIKKFFEQLDEHEIKYELRLKMSADTADFLEPQ